LLLNASLGCGHVWVTGGIWKQCFHTVCSNESNNVIYISISSTNISGTIVDNYRKPNA